MSNSTPKGSRTHIAIFGRRNAGKSSFLNAFVGQDVSIVSDTPGTTTDPVEKAYELQPFGPVLFIDTAGIDDTGELGEKRIKKTKEVIKRADFAFLIVEKDKFSDFERKTIDLLTEKKIPWVIVLNKIDLYNKDEIDQFAQSLKDEFKTIVYKCSSLKNEGINNLKAHVANELDKNTYTPPIIADLVKQKDLVVLVIPVDNEAPQGRIILPQVQTLRELLDSSAVSLVVKETELKHSFAKIMKSKPKLVVTDSQAFYFVSKVVPKNVMLTSFSILYARQKGDLQAYVDGAKALDKLKDGDTILISELCSHRPIGEDIGRVKIPRWIKEFKKVNIKIEVCPGKIFPEDLTKYKLIIQCGGCVVNRRLIMSRIEEAKKQGVPITNYGVAIAYLNGILKRVLTPFKNEQKRRNKSS